jgi:hypothetical protein
MELRPCVPRYGSPLGYVAEVHLVQDSLALAGRRQPFALGCNALDVELRASRRAAFDEGNLLRRQAVETEDMSVNLALQFVDGGLVSRALRGEDAVH